MFVYFNKLTITRLGDIIRALTNISRYVYDITCCLRGVEAVY